MASLNNRFRPRFWARRKAQFLSRFSRPLPLLCGIGRRDSTFPSAVSIGCLLNSNDVSLATSIQTSGIGQVTIDLTRVLDRVETAETPPRPAQVRLPSSPALSLLPPRESQGKGPSPKEGDTLRRPRVSPLPDLALARAVYTEAMTAVQSIFEGAKTGAPLNSGAAQEVVHSLMETVLDHHAALMSLMHIRQFEANL